MQAPIDSAVGISLYECWNRCNDDIVCEQFTYDATSQTCNFYAANQDVINQISDVTYYTIGSDYTCEPTTPCTTGEVTSIINDRPIHRYML